MIDSQLFNSDDFKKQVLQSENIPEADISVEDELKDIISSAPVIPQGRGIKTIIQDASVLARQGNQERADQINASLNEVMTRYNQEYGLDLHIDFRDMSRTLVEIADPVKRRTLELYLSQIFGSVRVILLTNIISKLGLIIDYCLDPERLFGSNSSMTHQDLFLVIEKLMQYSDQLEQMKKDIQIKGDDLELKRLGEESHREEDNLSSEAVDEFMELFNKERKDKDDIQN